MNEGCLPCWIRSGVCFGFGQNVQPTNNNMSNSDQNNTPAAADPEQPCIHPILPSYCQICSFPPEYCEYGASISKCKKWLQEHDSGLYERLYGPGPLVEGTEKLSLADQQLKTDDTEALRKEAKEDAKASRILAQKKNHKVTVKTIERTKRKRITTVHGLHLFGVDLKKLAKLFANKFATGASVTKNNQGDDEIVIQGDVSDEVLDLFESTDGKFADIIGNGKIPDDNIVFVDDTKKKKPTS